MTKKILFVNKNDVPIGSGTKEEAWKTGAHHRIVKIFLFNMLYTAQYDGDVHPGPEVSETRWIAPDALLAWMEERPDDFTKGLS